MKQELSATTSTCSVRGEPLRLLHQRAVFWPSRSCLMISDLHLGKGHHFSKGGIPLPTRVDRDNLSRLHGLMEVFRPKELLLLGDLFHSEINAHVDEAAELFRSCSGVRKILVEGNHDILEEAVYDRLDLEVFRDPLAMGPFLFSHEPLTGEERKGLYNICGHIHPGIRLHGRARQSLTLPCFWFGEEQAVLPAFGNMTGLYRIRPKEGDRVFAIADRTIYAF